MFLVLVTEATILKATDRAPFIWLSLGLCPLGACDWYLQHECSQDRWHLFSGDKDPKNEKPQGTQIHGDT